MAEIVAAVVPAVGLGGECPDSGYISSKMTIRAGKSPGEARRADGVSDHYAGSAGMTGQQAHAASLLVRVGATDLAPSARGWIDKAGSPGSINLLEQADCGVLVGATSVGPAGDDDAPARLE
ncbi:hypothetical protein [Arthrobacter sp. H35-D1]|uniref:hypothetical protein n=1 Tax=Arthrobacter sp. H35-D1 TaxID=3046202 RepID=UPI0024B8A77C|nr:hypothetical protein [Arthrobacter sp. H35-D1]MDJ0314150.1 hypothetical protein [Arthrobacter sp. H35-D1]